MKALNTEGTEDFAENTEGSGYLLCALCGLCV